ncbi:ABC transporter ATP-binding protein [Spongorhabdus nitratireducens]
MTTFTPLLTLDGIQCGYAEQTVINGIDLQIGQGEICALLGSSGCGKTTTLRTIAGFEPVQQGSIKLGNTLLASPSYLMPPEQRGLGMVFQDYALFPHLTVLDNVTFGLKGQSDKNHRGKQLLELVGLPKLENRYPHELSGGQQQRVALARALAPEPALLLMDEPFSNLDTDLRRQLSREVRQILKQNGTSAILVTHDQEEAFAFADKIGVMNQGLLEQWGTPWQIYHEPATPFVANFIGQGSLIPGTVRNEQQIDTLLGVITSKHARQYSAGASVRVLLRSDDFSWSQESPIQGNVISKTFTGAATQYELQFEESTKIHCQLNGPLSFEEGEQIRIKISATDPAVFAA